MHRQTSTPRSEWQVQAQELEDIGDQAARAQTAVEVNGLRLKADNRKWLLSKLAPKKYGDKLELSGDKESPLTVQIVRYADDSATQ